MSTALGIGLMAQGGGGWLGGSYYIENLCRALLSLPAPERKAFRITLIGSEQQIGQMGTLPNQVDATLVLDRQPKFDFWQRQQFRWQRIVQGRTTPWTDRMLAKASIDFVYPYCPQDGSERPFRSAAWQPDFQHCEMPAMFKPREIEERDKEFLRALQYADQIVLSSENARGHCAIHFPAAAAKIRVMPFASVLDSAALSGDPREAIEQYHLPDRFFILSNQFWRHKNHSVVWAALSLLRDRGVRTTLVCTGHTYDYRHPEYFDQLLDQLHRNRLAEQVRILGVVPRHLQLLMMRHSVAVIQPSLFEGWSTAVEDARALGCRTVLSDTDIHREQNPPGSQFFEATNPQALANVLQNSWESAPTGVTRECRPEAAENQLERVRAYARRFIEIARQEVEP